MKSKTLSVFAFAACLLTGFTSCSDNDDYTTPSQDSTQTDVADYTVIYWGSAGNNEAWTLNDMANLMVKREDGSINNKVNLVGCIDPTMKYSEALAAKNLGGTIEFELGTKRNTGADTLSVFNKYASFENGWRLDEEEGQKRDDSTYINPEFVELYSKVFSSMKSCKANSEYDIYSSQSLAQFIAKAAKEHPAKNYVLLLYGHGNGFVPTPNCDAKASITSRSCVSSTDENESMLSLNDITKAITGSGVKIKTVFYQCCQMASLENFASMQNCTDYVIASAEQTISGYFPQFMTYLSEVGGTDEGMKTACKKTVDFYADDCLGNSVNTRLSSHGFYDLSMTQNLLGCVKDAAAWFASAAKTNPTFMNDVVFGSVEVKSIGTEGTTYSETHEIQNTYNNALKGGKLTLDNSKKLSEMVTHVMYSNMSNMFGVCFASMMEKALSEDLAAEAQGLDMKALDDINKRYLSTLKQMAHIRCNGTETDNAAYRFASPSVNLFSMNEKGFHLNMREYLKEDDGEDRILREISKPYSANDAEGAYKAFVEILDGTIIAALVPSLTQVKTNYQSTDFDKATGWSKVLENVNVNPLLLVNPTRYDIINKF